MSSRHILQRTAVLAAGLVMLPLGPVGTAPLAAAEPTITGQATQLLSYGAASWRVPSDWPVYDLSRDPARCVRLDVHAVYLGAANPDARCPSRMLGRTEAVQVEPDSAPARARAALAAAAGTAPPATADSAATPTLDNHELVRHLDRLGVVVTASYGTAARVADQIVSSFVPSEHPAVPVPGAAGAGGTGAGGAAAEPPKAVRSGGASTAQPMGSTVTPGIYTGPGFDTCGAPSTSAMTAWLASPYRSVGIYLGGAMRACPDGNLSASWVSAVTRQGWRLAPLYVGYQAPCVNQSGLAEFSRDPATAAGQAAAAARDAIARARYFGLPTGSPIYFDLESYDTGDITCRAAVLAFTNAWTVELHRGSFRSGVYSGSASGIRDIAGVVGRAGFVPPDGVWLARWNGAPGVFGDPYVPDVYWRNHQRLHQYLGGHNETWGGVTINIDTNSNDGLVVTGSPGAGVPGYGAGTVGPGVSGFTTSGSWSSGAPQGLRGMMVWTYSAGSAASASATWSPKLSPGRYDIAAFIPSDHAGGHGRYTITGAAQATVVINQNSYSNQFAALGRFATDANGRLTVRLTNDADPPQAHTVGADGMRFSGAQPLVPGMAWRAPADFNGDGRADIALWRPANGTWYIRGARPVRWGAAGDVPVAGNYTGGRGAELAVWRPATGRWYVRGLPSVRWGARGDIPLAADFTGDGRVDLAVWRWTTGTWYIRGLPPRRWGAGGDVPVAADFTGDGRADVAIWRGSTGRWYVAGHPPLRWGAAGDIVTPTRLRSRGPVDIAVWRPSNGTWYIRGGRPVRWGTAGDVAVAGDITGGGLADYAVWRPSNGVWYIRAASAVRWGAAGDIPV